MQSRRYPGSGHMLLKRYRGRIVALGTICFLWAVAPEVYAGDKALPGSFGLRLEEALNNVNPQVPNGWEWLQAQVQPDHALISFGPPSFQGDCSQAPICLRITFANSDDSADLVRAGDLAIHVESSQGPADPSTAKALAQELAKRIVDSGVPVLKAQWVQVEEKGVAGDIPEGVFWFRILFLLLGAALLTVFVSEFRNIRWKWASAAAGLCAGMWLVIWFVAPRGVMAEDHSGYLFLTAFRSDVLPAHGVYSSLLVLLQWLGHTFGGGDDLYFAANALLISVAAPLLGLFVGWATGSVAAGWVGACLWASTPLVLRLGGAETLFSLVLTGLLGSALLLGRGLLWLQKGRWLAVPSLVAAALLAVAAFSSALMALWLAPAVLTMALALLPGMSRRTWAVFVLFGLVTAGLLVPQVLSAMEVAQGAGTPLTSLWNLLALDSWTQRLVVDTNWVSPTLPLFALWGVVAWCLKDRRSATWALASLGWVLGVSLTLVTCVNFRLAKELPLLALITVFGAVGIVDLVKRLHKSRPLQLRSTETLLMGIAVVSALWPIEVLRFTPPETLEYRFLKQEILPWLRGQSGASLLLPGPEAVMGPRHPLPGSWITLEVPGITLTEGTRQGPLPDSGPANPTPGAVPQTPVPPTDDAGPRYVYVGLSCQGTEFPASCGAADQTTECAKGPVPLLPVCGQQLRGLRLEPVITMAIPAAPRGFLCVDFPGVEVNIGLYRVVGSADLLDMKP